MRGLLPCEGAAETGLSARGVETGGLLRKPLAGALPAMPEGQQMLHA